MATLDLDFLEDILSPDHVREVRDNTDLFSSRLPEMRRLNNDFRRFANKEISPLLDIWYLPLFSLSALNGKSLPAFLILLELFRSGQLRPGMTFVGESSGNTAVGWAYLSRIFEVHFVAVVKPSVPIGKQRQIEDAGGEVNIVPGNMTPDEYVDYLAETHGWVKVDQYRNWNSVVAHQIWTAPHIAREMKRHGENPSIACIPTGTTSTLVALNDLKKTWPAMKLIGVASADNEEVPGARTRERLKATGFGYESVIDYPLVLETLDGSTTMRKELVRYGVTGGPTSGMGLAGSLRFLNDHYAKGGMKAMRPFLNHDGRIVSILVFMDTHLVYLSE